MAATMATMATMLNPKCYKHPSKLSTATPKPISLLSLHTSISKTHLTSGAIAGAVFTALSHTDNAFAVQQLAEIAESSTDNRGLALLLPLVPAILWVLYNILKPALNQINKMRDQKGVIVGLGLGGGLAASGFLYTPSASAAVDSTVSSGDNRGVLLLFVIAPAVGWVLYNILQPALNQINKMRSG